MKFLKILDALKEEYKDNFKIRDNGTLLLAPSTVPRARHMLFKPLNNELIEEFLISQYVHRFPNQYIEFLKYSNGADLCNVKVWHTIKKKKIAAAGGCLLYMDCHELNRTDVRKIWKNLTMLELKIWHVTMKFQRCG